MLCRDIYWQGSCAWYAGVKFEDCPYVDTDDGDWLDWEEGWLDARWEDELNGQAASPR